MASHIVHEAHKHTCDLRRRDTEARLMARRDIKTEREGERGREIEDIETDYYTPNATMCTDTTVPTLRG